jgi:hypothetical protein
MMHNARDISIIGFPGMPFARASNSSSLTKSSPYLLGYLMFAMFLYYVLVVYYKNVFSSNALQTHRHTQTHTDTLER